MRRYYHKKWLWYYPLKLWLKQPVIKYTDYLDNNREYQTYGCTASSNKGISYFYNVPNNIKLKWAIEVVLNPYQWLLKWQENKDLKNKRFIEQESLNDLATNQAGYSKPLKIEKRPKEKELNKWYEDNQELAELDDYARQKNWSWSNSSYQEKLKVYAILTNSKFDDLDGYDPWDMVRPKLGRHNFYQITYDKFSKDEKWKETRTHLFNTCKKS